MQNIWLINSIPPSSETKSDWSVTFVVLLRSVENVIITFHKNGFSSSLEYFSSILFLSVSLWWDSFWLCGGRYTFQDMLKHMINAYALGCKTRSIHIAVDVERRILHQKLQHLATIQKEFCCTRRTCEHARYFINYVCTRTYSQRAK